MVCASTICRGLALAFAHLAFAETQQILGVAKCDAGVKKFFNNSAKWAMKGINAQLPRLLRTYNLDPLVDIVHDRNVSVPHSYGCTELCVFFGPICADYWLHVNSVDVHGLSRTKLLPFEINDCYELAPQEDCVQCRIGPRHRAFRGNITAVAELDLTVQVDLLSDGGGLHATCATLFGHWTHLVWAGNATCNLTSAKLNIKIEPCGALCTPSSAALACGTIVNVTLSNNDFKCDFHHGGGIHHLPDIIHFFLPHIEQDLVKTLSSVVQKAMNSGLIDELIDKLYIPRNCSREVAIIV